MNLRLSTIDDALLLLDWRNDELTRLNAFTSEIIPLTNHLNWYQKVLLSPTQNIYIAEIKEIPVGTIRADDSGKGFKELTWSVSPSHRGKGYGSLILNTFISIYPSVYIAQIKPHNIASIKMVERNGFTLLSKETDKLIFVKKLSDLEIIDTLQNNE